MINAIVENFSSLKLDTSDVLLVLLDLVHEVARDEEYNNDEESDQNLHLELSFLDESGQSNTNGEGALAIRISILGKIISCFFISHNLKWSK